MEPIPADHEDDADEAAASSAMMMVDHDPVDEAIMKNDAVEKAAANNSIRDGGGGGDFPELFHSVTAYFDQRQERAAQMLTGRFPTPLYLSCDYQSLSEYQMLVRKQIELFEATCDDVDFDSQHQQGRSKTVVLGQVGIRCRHCSRLPPPTASSSDNDSNNQRKKQKRGSVYYPAKLDNIYQAAQNMASIHLCEHCPSIPPELRRRLLQLRDGTNKASRGGKAEWAQKARALGVYEDEHGLRFAKCSHGGAGGGADSNSLT